MPRYAASRALAARVEDVWSVVADPARFPDWWPGVVRVDPGRRGLVPGALWRVEGRDRFGALRRPGVGGNLLVIEVEPRRRVVFQLVDERIDADLELEPEQDGTRVVLVVDGTWFGAVRRGFPQRALARLAAATRLAS